MTPPAADYQAERRPIKSRERAVSQRLAKWLVDKKVTPNAISLAGMISGIAAGGSFALTPFPAWTAIGFLAAAGLMQLRLLANMLDGMVAVESGTASPLGELYNEVPDRVADAAMFIGAGYALGSSLELGYLAATLAIFVAYIRAQGKVAGAPQEFCGPLAKPQRVFLMTAAAVVCAILPLSVHSRMNDFQPGFLSSGVMSWVLMVSLVGMVVTAVRRLYRVAIHLRREEI